MNVCSLCVPLCDWLKRERRGKSFQAKCVRTWDCRSSERQCYQVLPSPKTKFGAQPRKRIPTLCNVVTVRHWWHGRARQIFPLKNAERAKPDPPSLIAPSWLHSPLGGFFALWDLWEDIDRRVKMNRGREIASVVCLQLFYLPIVPNFVVINLSWRCFTSQS